MLYFLDNYILAVDENEDITGTELNRIRPSLDGGIEGMRGNSNYGQLVSYAVPDCAYTNVCYKV